MCKQKHRETCWILMTPSSLHYFQVFGSFQDMQSLSYPETGLQASPIQQYCCFLWNYYLCPLWLCCCSCFCCEGWWIIISECISAKQNDWQKAIKHHSWSWYTVQTSTIITFQQILIAWCSYHVMFNYHLWISWCTGGEACSIWECKYMAHGRACKPKIAQTVAKLSGSAADTIRNSMYKYNFTKGQFHLA